MPILKSGKKAITRDARRRVSNDRRRRTMREQIKSFKKLLVAKNATDATALVPKLYQSIDKSVKAGIIKKNTGARKKSRLQKALKNLG